LHNVSGMKMFSNRIFLELLHLQIDSQVEDVIRIEAYLPPTCSEPVHKGWRYRASNVCQLVVRASRMDCKVFVTQGGQQKTDADASPTERP
jgi:hypothetical protein